jgi:hypothetical protein
MSKLKGLKIHFELKFDYEPNPVVVAAIINALAMIICSLINKMP